MRVLVVEDDSLLCRSMTATLEDERFAVDLAQDGEEGLYKAREDLYDVIVLDVMLPLLDGWQILDRLRPDIKTPILMLTARDTVADRIKGLNKGADDYLIKPFDTDELIARLKALIRRNSGLVHSQIKIEDLTVDFSLRQVMLDECVIPLTAREYCLLEYLAINRGKVVSRSLLYERLFDENEDTSSNLLDVHISNVRKKLGHGIIHTRRGHGYVIL